MVVLLEKTMGFDSWFAWWSNHLGPSISPKRTPMTKLLQFASANGAKSSVSGWGLPGVVWGVNFTVLQRQEKRRDQDSSLEERPIECFLFLALALWRFCRSQHHFPRSSSPFLFFCFFGSLCFPLTASFKWQLRCHSTDQQASSRTMRARSMVDNTIQFEKRFIVYTFNLQLCGWQ